MKTRILVVLLCLACISSYAQRKRKKKATAPAQTAQQQQPATFSPNAATSAKPTGIDTTKKAGPVKPFERPLDGYFKKTNILSAKVTPYPNLRESDVAFAKRVWREIDLREKMNAYLVSPKQRLIDVLLNAIDAGELTAYDPISTKDDPGGDSFSVPLAQGKARSKMADSSVVDKFDANGNKVGSTVQAGEFNPDSVIKFRIKEDWVFDRQRSIFEPRIVGIAPMIKVKIANNEDYQPAFWVYFPEARHILATKEVVSRNSDATGLSFDDAFVKRIFTSYIVKESNDKDERIKDYASGIDRLYEAERMKKTLMDWELTLWQY
ncbi:type IX secretion system ring subunit PorN/GldN [Mucilaginibacter xinganensis]|uniref:Gliding motility protein GldN n=1 Tax=Mucilaginibacter xinganensis TaxID=1234841 RepID=A0A223NTM2_9SPHI|nr:gliding motility protein GldN [Mucilaginibacter xinganensis]ASU32851.1 gliding motility protein GldN [Mucilaginibacter xinganensis]